MSTALQDTIEPGRIATVIGTRQMRYLTRLARDAGRNRYPTRELLAALDRDGLHVLEFEMIHNDREMRTGWLVKIKGEDDPYGPVFLDMSFEDFKFLPKLRKTDSGEWERV